MFLWSPRSVIVVSRNQGLMRATGHNRPKTKIGIIFTKTRHDRSPDMDDEEGMPIRWFLGSGLEDDKERSGGSFWSWMKPSWSILVPPVL